MKKKPKKQSLADRVKALRDECDAELDRLAEAGRPSSIPACSIRAMWMARGAGHIFDAYLVAVGEV